MTYSIILDITGKTDIGQQFLFSVRWGGGDSKKKGGGGYIYCLLTRFKSFTYDTLCYIMLHYVTLCYIMLHYVTLCYIMLHYVTLCYSTLF